MRGVAMTLKSSTRGFLLRGGESIVLQKRFPESGDDEPRLPHLQPPLSAPARAHRTPDDRDGLGWRKTPTTEHSECPLCLCLVLIISLLRNRMETS
mmetsp:Transcript_25529/g.60558  ORF Transcript_25529/g.60558 Transcript_25529/m.60558 type:complete len:96 (+) Transcript_25529:1297-1584(+)